jgi:hypothetical protein
LDAIIASAFAQFHASEPATLTRLTSFVLEQFQIPLIPDPLGKVRLSDGRLRPAIIKPSELNCIHVPCRMIPDYFAALGELLGRVPSGLLWNMGKLGHADWPDAYLETVCIPIEFESDSVPILVSRTSKRTR